MDKLLREFRIRAPRPLAGVLALALAWMPRGRVWAVATLALVLGTGTVLRNQDYRTEVALWSDTVRHSPDKARAWNNLGYALQLEGRPAEARRAYERALALDPEHLPARINLMTQPR